MVLVHKENLFCKMDMQYFLLNCFYMVELYIIMVEATGVEKSWGLWDCSIIIIILNSTMARKLLGLSLAIIICIVFHTSPNIIQVFCVHICSTNL